MIEMEYVCVRGAGRKEGGAAFIWSQNLSFIQKSSLFSSSRMGHRDWLVMTASCKSQITHQRKSIKLEDVSAFFAF